MEQRKTKLARQLRSNQTDAEKILWYQIRAKRFHTLKFKRQQPIGDYIVDFVNLEKKLIIELDGGQHNEETNIQKDTARTTWLEKEGYTVLRFWNNDVFSNMDGVLHSIEQAIIHPHPNLLPSKGEGTSI